MGLKAFHFPLEIRKVLARHLLWVTAAAELCGTCDWQALLPSSCFLRWPAPVQRPSQAPCVEKILTSAALIWVGQRGAGGGGSALQKELRQDGRDQEAGSRQEGPQRL